MTETTTTTTKVSETDALELLEKVIDGGLVKSVGASDRQLSMTCQWENENALEVTVWDEDADATDVGTFLVVIEAVSR